MFLVNKHTIGNTLKNIIYGFFSSIFLLDYTVPAILKNPVATKFCGECD